MIKVDIYRVITLIRKELLALFRDTKGRVVLIIPPLLQLFIFSFAATLEVKNVNLAIYNADSGIHSVRLIDRFKSSRTFTKITLLRSYDEIHRTIDEQKTIAVLNIPQDFSRRIENAKTAPLQIILDGRKSNAAQIVNGYMNQVIMNYQNELRGNKITQVEIQGRSWFNENLKYIWFTLPSLVGILTMLIALVVTALSVARERELGTFDQLLVSPLNPLEILIGKTAPAIIVAVLEGSFMIAVSVFVFKIPFKGSILLLLLALFVFALSIIGIGLFISSISQTQQQAILGTFTFMVPAVTLSGYAAPIENMPQALQILTWFNPLKYFLLISRGIYLKDMPLDLVLANLYPIMIIGTVNLLMASWFFKRKI